VPVAKWLKFQACVGPILRAGGTPACSLLEGTDAPRWCLDVPVPILLYYYRPGTSSSLFLHFEEGPRRPLHLDLSDVHVCDVLFS